MSAHTALRLALIATGLALVGVVAAVFAPATYSYGTNRLSAGSENLWDRGLDTGRVEVYLAVLAVAAVGISIGAYLLTRRPGPAALFVLWLSALVYLAGALMTLPGDNTAVVPGELYTGTPDSVGIGVYLVLPALIGVGVALAITLARRAAGRPKLGQPHPLG